MNVDSQGVRRGSCSRCDCKEFATKYVKCRCGHPPIAHVDLSTGSASGTFAHHDVNNSLCSNDEVEWESVVSLESAGQFNFRSANVVEAWSGLGGYDFSGTSVVEGSSFLYCQIPGCNDVANFDLNTRQYTSAYCYNHSSTVPVLNAVSNVPSVPSQPNMMITNSGQSLMMCHRKGQQNAFCR